MRLFDGTNHPAAQQVIDADCGGCLMYGGTPQYSKNYTPAQYRDYKARSLLTAFVFEDGANDMAGGFNGGSAHASALLADLHRGGVANTEPVAPTVDEHVTATNIPLAVAYQNGFWSYVKSSGWLGPVGTYGFSELLIAVHKAGLAEWYWGAGSRSAMPPYTNVWQDNTGTIQVGGSADDSDWILIPLPGGTVTTQDDLKAVLSGDWRFDTRNPVDMWRQTVATGFAIQASLAALAGTLSTQDAAILAAVQGTDADTKAATAQLATAIGGVDADVKAGAAAVSDTQIATIVTALKSAVGSTVVQALGTAIVKGSAA
jgi:hypothetical protein